MLPEILPPQDREAEEALLGSVLIDDDVIEDVLPVIPDEGAFYDSSRQTIYRCLVAMHRARMPFDVVTVKDHLEQGNQLETIGGVEYLVRLMESVPSAANAVHYARIVREHHRRRSIMQLAHAAYRELATPGDADGLVESASGFARAIQICMDYGAGAELERIDQVAQRVVQTAGLDECLPTEINGLERFGPYAGDYIVVGARPGVGKTSLLLQIALATAQANRHVLFFSQEQPPLQIVQRLLSRLSGVNVFDLRSGRFDHGPESAVSQAVKTLSKVRDYLHIAGHQRSVGEMTHLVNRTRRRINGRLALVCLDYLQIVPVANRNGTRNDQLSEVSAEVASWRHDGPCVLAASQLNREGRDKPQIAHLRDSGSLEQDADGVWLLHSPVGEHGVTAKAVEMIVAKQRSGPTGELWLTFFPAEFTFTGPQDRSAGE